MKRGDYVRQRIIENGYTDADADKHMAGVKQQGGVVWEFTQGEFDEKDQELRPAISKFIDIMYPPLNRN